ncbi:MAG: iron ABC transporter permease [Verrucomicrobia bacterium]|nr:iron ABC transporter permease [Verrucomicrobiota bacterium]
MPTDDHAALKAEAVARRGRLVCVVLLIAVIAAAFGVMLIETHGLTQAERLPAGTVLRIVASRVPLVGRVIDVGDVHKNDMRRVLDLRLPRVLLAVVVGAGLAVAGAVMQSFFQNPMASPYLLGAASGASLGAAIAFTTGLVTAGARSVLGLSVQSWFAFCGAVGVTFLVYALARRGGRTNTAVLLLTGIAVGTFAGGLAYLIMFLSEQQHIAQVLAWVMGTLDNRGWHEFAVAGCATVAGVGLVRVFARDLNVMLLGAETAQHLGVHVERTRLVLLVIASLLTAVAVAAVGILGFVGLVVPHIMRLVVGPDHRTLIPASVLGGALLVLGADAAVKGFFAEQVPLGVLTTLVGCPFFVALLMRREKTFI